MFKKGERIIYPIYGAGKIADLYETDFNEEPLKYFRIEFDNTPLSVSVPVDNAEILGLRKPHSKRDLKKMLKSLNKTVRLDTRTMRNVNVTSQEKIDTGKVADVIGAINLLSSVKKKSIRDGKNFSYTSARLLESATQFLTSEVKIVLGKEFAKELELSFV